MSLPGLHNNGCSRHNMILQAHKTHAQTFQLYRNNNSRIIIHETIIEINPNLLNLSTTGIRKKILLNFCFSTAPGICQQFIGIFKHMTNVLLRYA